jgi:hypothetical protein
MAETRPSSEVINHLGDRLDQLQANLDAVNSKLAAENTKFARFLKTWGVGIGFVGGLFALLNGIFDAAKNVEDRFVGPRISIEVSREDIPLEYSLQDNAITIRLSLTLINEGKAHEHLNLVRGYLGRNTASRPEEEHAFSVQLLSDSKQLGLPLTISEDGTQQLSALLTSPLSQDLKTLLGTLERLRLRLWFNASRDEAEGVRYHVDQCFYVGSAALETLLKGQTIQIQPEQQC